MRLAGPDGLQPCPDPASHGGAHPPECRRAMAALRGNEIGCAAEAEIEAECREAEAVAALHELNAEFIRGLGGGGSSWYATHLSRDFVCTLAGGRRAGKEEFLRRVEAVTPWGDVACEEIDVHPLGEVALVHGAIHAGCEGGFALTRYTAIWQLLGQRWEMIAVQFTPVKPRIVHAVVFGA